MLSLLLFFGGNHVGILILADGVEFFFFFFYCLRKRVRFLWDGLFDLFFPGLPSPVVFCLVCLR